MFSLPANHASLSNTKDYKSTIRAGAHYYLSRSRLSSIRSDLGKDNDIPILKKTFIGETFLFGNDTPYLSDCCRDLPGDVI